MNQYAEAYSALLDRYLIQQAEKIVPGGESRIGIWTNGQAYQRRTRTDRHPDPVTFVSNDVARELITGAVHSPALAVLKGFGTIHLQLTTFQERTPQKLAWYDLSREVVEILRGQMLDESACPYILQERIWDTLTGSPSIWFTGTPMRKRYWSLLGYSDVPALESADLTDLAHRIDDLLKEFHTKVPRDRRLEEMDSIARWYFFECQDLVLLRYWLTKLLQHQSKLGSLDVDLDELFKYLRTRDLESTRSFLQRLIPRVADSYKAMYKTNFPTLSAFSPFLSHIDHLAFVEIAKRAHSDFLTVSYLVCPSISPSEGPKVFLSTNRDPELVAKIEYDTLTGWVRTSGSGFGHNADDMDIGGTTIRKKQAIMNRTTYPSRTPVTDQAYRLIGNELKVLFPSDRLTWTNLDNKIYNKDRMVSWALSEPQRMRRKAQV